jgi:hypothetical protein
MRWGWIAFSLVILSGAPADATQEKLVAACRLYTRDSPVNLEEARVASECFQYIRAFYDGWTAASLYTEPAAGLERFRICFPEGVSWTQLAKIYVKWADDNPQDLHLSEWQGVRESWRTVYPCRK